MVRHAYHDFITVLQKCRILLTITYYEYTTVSYSLVHIHILYKVQNAVIGQ